MSWSPQAFAGMIPPSQHPEFLVDTGQEKKRTGQREDRRFVVSQPARLHLRGAFDQVWEAHISDISRRGMQLVVDRPAAASGRVRIEWNGREIHGNIRYQRQDGSGYRLGIELASSWESLVNDVLARQTEELRSTNAALELQAAVLQHQANLLDLTYDTILVTSMNGSISSWNQGAEHMYGWSQAEAAGRNVHQILGTVFPCDPGEVDSSLLREGRWEGELAQVRKDGSRIVVTSRLALHRTPQGEPAFIMAINSDITDKKKAEEALVSYANALKAKNEELAVALEKACEASEVKSRFLASVSHELRTPLNGIIGLSQLLHDGLVGPLTADQTGCLADVLRCSNHLLTLISQVLDLSKIESGKMEFEYQSVSLEELVRESIDSLRGISSAKAVQVQWRVEPAVSVVRTDPARMRQVFFNYLSNALKFTPAGGSVKVDVLCEGDSHFRIQVEDNGIGIRKEDLPCLFTEFGQIGRSEKSHNGTGLGLAITKRIVEALGGEVGVSSTPGEGSRFYAVLPRTPSRQLSD